VIKVCHLASTPHLKLASTYSSFYLMLAHVKDEGYWNFFKQLKKESPKFKLVLDCGTLENGVPVTNKRLFDKAVEVGADAIVAPDHFRDCKRTIESTEKFIDFLKERNRLEKTGFEIWAAAQGRSVEEYFTSFLRFYNNPDIDKVCLSYIIVKEVFDPIVHGHRVMPNRLYLTKLLNELQLTKKPIHLFGLGNPIELKYQRIYPFIKSCDSSAAFALASRQLSLESKGYDRDIKVIDLNRRLSGPEADTFEHNMRQINKWRWPR